MRTALLTIIAILTILFIGSIRAHLNIVSTMKENVYEQLQIERERLDNLKTRCDIADGDLVITTHRHGSHSRYGSTDRGYSAECWTETGPLIDEAHTLRLYESDYNIFR